MSKPKPKSRPKMSKELRALLAHRPVKASRVSVCAPVLCDKNGEILDAAQVAAAINSFTELPRGEDPFIITTVSYRRVRGKLRQVYNVRLAPLETERFRFGLPLGKTLSKERADRHIAHVTEYLRDWLDYEYAPKEQVVNKAWKTLALDMLATLKGFRDPQVAGQFAKRLTKLGIKP